MSVAATTDVSSWRKETKGLPGTPSDPRIQPVFVGTREMVELGATAGRQEQYGGLYIWLFPTLDDALAHIRAGVGAPG